MENINRLPEFGGLSEEQKETLRAISEINRQMWEQFNEEQRQFDEAWDKRAKECAELERMMNG